MKFEFKPVRKKIDLAEYAEEMNGAEIRVQVNVSREMLARMQGVNRETPIAEFAQLLSELWGQEDWPVDEVQALIDHCMDRDPQLWKWLTGKTWELIFDYQAGQKKV